MEISFYHKKHYIQKVLDKYYCNETLKEAIEKAKDFCSITSSEILKTKIPSKLNDFPKFSVVVPTHSNEKTIKRLVRSAQNQNFSDFEIIIIDDYSEDNTVKIIEELIIEDKRIKIIKNKINRGTLYSRCIGTLESKGSYILSIDSDDMFLNNDVFYSLSEEIDKTNVDIIRFRGIETFNLKNPLDSSYKRLSNRIIKENHILYQPKIANHFKTKCCLYMQCINSYLYKKAINLYGKERMNLFITHFEDCIMHFIIYELAKTKELFLKIGYIHALRGGSSSRSLKAYLVNKYYIYLNEAYLEFDKYSTWDTNWVIGNIIRTIKRNDFQETIKDDIFKKYIKDLLKRILLDKSININSKIKEELMNSSLSIN